jgi:hypothetical protein
MLAVGARVHGTACSYHGFGIHNRNVWWDVTGSFLMETDTGSANPRPGNIHISGEQHHPILGLRESFLQNRQFEKRYVPGREMPNSISKP